MWHHKVARVRTIHSSLWQQACGVSSLLWKLTAVRVLRPLQSHNAEDRFTLCLCITTQWPVGWRHVTGQRHIDWATVWFFALWSPTEWLEGYISIQRTNYTNCPSAKLTHWLMKYPVNSVPKHQLIWPSLLTKQLLTCREGPCVGWADRTLVPAVCRHRTWGTGSIQSGPGQGTARTPRTQSSLSGTGDPGSWGSWSGCRVGSCTAPGWSVHSELGRRDAVTTRGRHCLLTSNRVHIIKYNSTL